MRALGIGTSQFTLSNSSVSSNHAVCSGTVDCRNGGMGLQGEANAVLTITGNTFHGNSVTIASGSVLAGGAGISNADSASLMMEDNDFTDNTVSGTSGGGTGVAFGVSGSGPNTVRRNFVFNNTASLPNPSVVPQVSFFQFGDGVGILSDTAIVSSNVKGLVANTFGDGSPVMHLTNLTVADNERDGIQVSKGGSTGGSLNLSNVIATGNATFSGSETSLSGAITEATNRFGGDAGFVDAAGGNYRLADGSPAINAGSNSPPGGLGPTDLDGNARVLGGTVDQGAYEATVSFYFEDGYESE